TVTVDLALAEHDPAALIPRRRGVDDRRDRIADPPAPHADARVTDAADVAIAERDRLDDPLVRRHLDHARPLTLPEDVPHVRGHLRAVAELDRHVDQLHVAVLDDDREPAEPTLVTADADRVDIEPAVAVD